MAQKSSTKIPDRRESERIHDRRASDILAAGQYAAMEVEDPFDANAKIVVLRQLRCDPLARLHAHHQIDEAQYHAGRAYQRDWETAERGARAIDPTKEAVDGGQFPEPLTDGQINARKRLVALENVLGRTMHRVAYAFLIEGQHVEHMAIAKFRRHGDRWANYYGKMLRDALDELAIQYKLAG